MSWFNKHAGHKSSPAPEIRIGAQYGGGIIFYVNRTGKHGLIAAKSDMPGYSSALAALKDISEGFFNWKDAVDSCEQLEINGHSDWFLPSKEQLNLIYLHKGAVGGFVHASSASSNYWSSSESSDGSAWIMDFSHFGSQTLDNKESYNRVRAVRVF
jgi:hypothetical protein